MYGVDRGEWATRVKKLELAAWEGRPGTLCGHAADDGDLEVFG